MASPGSARFPPGGGYARRTGHRIPPIAPDSLPCYYSVEDIQNGRGNSPIPDHVLEAELDYQQLRYDRQPSSVPYELGHQPSEAPTEVNHQPSVAPPEVDCQPAPNPSEISRQAFEAPPAYSADPGVPMPPIIQSTLMYGMELSWMGKAPEAKDYQLAINRMARGEIGAFQLTLLGPILEESGMTPAIPLLNHRQLRYVQRILQQPEETRGAKETLLETKNSALSKRLRGMTLLDNNKIEKTYLARGNMFVGKIMPDREEEEARRIAMEWNDWQDTAWMDGSCLDDGR
ncbi:hypothetical protein FPQ18DRAFT_416816 [Pyronema domesticum]|nr:hypothetical protein FPQ18DRAFT_416816 [Pyronema domesticum]